MSLTSRLSIGFTCGLLLSLSTPLIIPAISYNGSIAEKRAAPFWYSEMPCSQPHNALFKTVQVALLPVRPNLAKRPLVSTLQLKLPKFKGNDAGAWRPGGHTMVYRWVGLR